MQTLTLAFVALAAMVATATAYTTKYDNIDLDDILHNDRLLKKYHECLVSDTDSSCTPDGKELKGNLPDALVTDCSKCNEKQQDGAYKVIRFLIEKKPDLWKPLQAKFDPENVYLTKHPELQKSS